MTWEQFWQAILGWLSTTGVRLVVSIVILWVSFRVINAVARRIQRRCTKKQVDKTLSSTLIYAGKIALKIAVAVGIVGYLGIDTSGIAALVASLGVCAGLAVNGALSNLAGGVLILVTRPFRVDDYIEAGGHSGTVEDIRLTMTRLRTPDNKIVYIPNGTLSSDTIINYSEKSTRRVDLTFTIAYSVDYRAAEGIILDLCRAHEKVLDTPAPASRVNAHGASGVVLTCRVWVNSGDYWDVYYDLMESVKTAFDEHGIEIPYDQVDVHIRET